MEHEHLKIPLFGDKPQLELVNAGYSPLLSAVLQARGVSTPEAAKTYLSRSSELLYDPLLLDGMEAAVARLKLAFERRENIAVYGDYDVDGISSSCLLCDYFRSRGTDCIIYIPDRIDEGYGVSADALRQLAEDGIRLVVTVDCGITALSEVEYAKSLGMDIIITDHHECPGTLPNATAVIDPKRPGSSYPFDGLAGVGVAFKLACALAGSHKPILEKYSDLAALGTIADVMPLTSENRALVYQGLEKLKSCPRPGLAALMEKSGASGRPLSASTVSFMLAPRINAAGRLCQTETSINLLLAENMDIAAPYADKLCELNRQRQELETSVWEEASSVFAKTPPSSPIVLAGDGWHPGVVGIAASRLSEEYRQPTIMICLDGEMGKGSCRSYGDFNLFEALSACSEHLEGFGGHAFAAGLNIRRDKIDAFRSALALYYAENPPKSLPCLEPELLLEDFKLLDIDGVLSLDELEPCGSDNPRPLMFACGLNLDSISEIGGGKHLRLRVLSGERHFDCVYFGHCLSDVDISPGSLVDLCFYPQINDFRGNRSVQLLVSDIRPSEISRYCLKSLDPDFLDAFAAFRPDRCDLALVWRSIKNCGGSMTLDLQHPNKSALPGMSALRLCLCLHIFKDLGLLTVSSGDSFISAKITDNSKKNALENSPIFRRLWNLQ